MRIFMGHTESREIYPKYMFLSLPHLSQVSHMSSLLLGSAFENQNTFASQLVPGIAYRIAPMLVPPNTARPIRYARIKMEVYSPGSG
jgi:hypothetical protein